MRHFSFLLGRIDCWFVSLVGPCAVPPYHACRHTFFFFQAEDGIRDLTVTGVQTCALPICKASMRARPDGRINSETSRKRQASTACPRRWEPQKLETFLGSMLHPRELETEEIGRASCRERV